MHASGGNIYNIPIVAASLSTGGPWDLCGLTAQSSGRLEVIGIVLTIVTTQFSTAPGLAITLLRGSSGTSTGTAILPQNVKGWSGASTAPWGLPGMT
jgi:hypothetical protein